jgi:hypothetical protein
MGCVYPMAVVSIGTVNIDYEYLFKSLISVLLGLYTGMELLDYVVILWVTF